MGKGFGLGSFVIGGLVGAAIGLLYAPKPGVETRAEVAEKVDALWGQGQTIYSQGVTKIQETVAGVQPVIQKQSDELRDKIENARTLIAGQVAKNAVAARDAINDKVPVAAEKISQVADVVRGQIDTAASALRSKAAAVAEEDAAEASLAAASASEKAPAEAAPAGTSAAADTSSPLFQ